jgi:hypothetical protein
MKKGNTKSAKEETQKTQSYRWIPPCAFCVVFALFVFHSSKLKATSGSLAGAGRESKI